MAIKQKMKIENEIFFVAYAKISSVSDLQTLIDKQSFLSKFARKLLNKR